ncbi:FeoC-like transcriptional regulator [Acidithiobacillus sp. AMEEHan]|uniref:FeoC-like transcriptional regulator n=1 Tax=Acidithiobacillus sp. AMEEHan TaxID=2994951 RepID=UPI0027E3D86D|nr:FeoC-like transcriptional regulator [Acidithiobacillus sp. AMEEHan]
MSNALFAVRDLLREGASLSGEEIAQRLSLPTGIVEAALEHWRSRQKLLVLQPLAAAANCSSGGCGSGACGKGCGSGKPSRPTTLYRWRELTPPDDPRRAEEFPPTLPRSLCNP